MLTIIYTILFTRYSTAAIGKWHLGWDRDWYGDNIHGPLGHGFDSFFGLPFTLVDGFERCKVILNGLLDCYPQFTIFV